jgi:hypothetical protein
MIWPAITSLMDSDEFEPTPPYPMDPTPAPQPLPFARKAKKAAVLHEVSHKDDDVIDTPEIQGEEE